MKNSTIDTHINNTQSKVLILMAISIKHCFSKKMETYANKIDICLKLKVLPIHIQCHA